MGIVELVWWCGLVDEGGYEDSVGYDEKWCDVENNFRKVCESVWVDFLNWYMEEGLDLVY